MLRKDFFILQKTPAKGRLEHHTLSHLRVCTFLIHTRKYNSTFYRIDDVNRKRLQFERLLSVVKIV